MGLICIPLALCIPTFVELDDVTIAPCVFNLSAVLAEIISANTADRLKTQGAIVSSSSSMNVGIQSAGGIQINPTTGGFTY